MSRYIGRDFCQFVHNLLFVAFPLSYLLFVGPIRPTTILFLLLFLFAVSRSSKNSRLYAISALRDFLRVWGWARNLPHSNTLFTINAWCLQWSSHPIIWPHKWWNYWGLFPRCSRAEISAKKEKYSMTTFVYIQILCLMFCFYSLLFAQATGPQQ